MRFTGPDAVTDPFGPKAINPLHARATGHSRATCRGPRGRPPATSGRARRHPRRPRPESSGMGVFAHELSHNLSLPDNYGNPFASPTSRSAGGMWDMMSRGSFNGPGGQHTRWQVPPTQGASLGAQHGIRHKQKLGFVPDSDMLRLNRDGLAQSGMAVAEVKAREVAPNGDVAGVQILLDGQGDLNPPAASRTTRSARVRGSRPTAQSRAASPTTRSRSCSRSARTRSSAATACWSARPRTARTAARSAAACGTSTPTRRTSTRSTTSRPTARRSRRRSATSASSTTARSTWA